MVIFKLYGKYYIANDIVVALIAAYLIKYTYNILNSLYRKRLSSSSKNTVAENCKNKDNSLKIRGGDLKLKVVQSLFEKVPDTGVCLVEDKGIISMIRNIFDKHYARKVLIITFRTIIASVLLVGSTDVVPVGQGSTFSNPRSFVGWTALWSGVITLSPYLVTLLPTGVGNFLPLVYVAAALTLARFNGLNVKNVSDALRCIPECAPGVVIDREIDNRSLRVYVTKQPEVELLARCYEYDDCNHLIYDPIKLDSVRLKVNELSIHGKVELKNRYSRRIGYNGQETDFQGVALTDSEVCESVAIEKRVPPYRKHNRKVHTIRDFCPIEDENPLAEEVFEMDSVDGLKPVRAERILDSDLISKITPKELKAVDDASYAVCNKGGKKK